MDILPPEKLRMDIRPEAVAIPQAAVAEGPMAAVAVQEADKLLCNFAFST